MALRYYFLTSSCGLHATAHAFFAPYEIIVLVLVTKAISTSMGARPASCEVVVIAEVVFMPVSLNFCFKFIFLSLWHTARDLVAASVELRILR